jgi:WD40-like Beta Propeller Repeat
MRASLARAFVTVLVAGVPASGAQAATYGTASILDLSPTAQFDLADSSVISADGRYVVFRGSVGGHIGIWRRDLETGALDPVAVDLQGLPANTSNFDPQAPSVSADGRYIAFNTRAPLDPVNDTAPFPRPWQVYVRDMNVPAVSPGAYTLASAVNGGTQSLTYGAGGTGSRIPGGTTNNPTNPQFASPGGAITADGRTVVFSVDSTSNLANAASVSTPPGQVAVRSLDTDTTKLVSVCTYNCSASGTTVGGPILWVSGLRIGGAINGDDAVISADGSTVAWLSQFGAVLEEAVTLTNEQQLYGSGGRIPSSDGQAVWRRIADGPAAPTLRITGEVDPLRADCPPGTPVTSSFAPPSGCDGPLNVFLAGVNGSNFSHLALSGDGREVALLSSAPLAGSLSSDVEAYRVDMHPGLTRDQATAALTQAGGTSQGAIPPREGDIVSDAISADGTTIALATRRTRFDLQSPSYLGPARPGLADGNELYVVNRHDDTLDLVSHAYNGALASYSPNAPLSGLSPSLSSDGSLLVFDSSANNLVWGDGNNASNVYVESRTGGPGDPGPASSQVSVPAPPPLRTKPAWVVHASSRSLANGDLKLYVLVPGSGRISVRVSAKLTVSHATRRRHLTRMVARTVATGRGNARRAGLTTLTVHLDSAYLALARRKTGLAARAQLVYSAKGAGTPLSDSLAVTFRARTPAATRKHGHGRRTTR